MPQIMKDTVAQSSERGRMLSADEVADVMMRYLDVNLEENGKTVVIK